MRPKVDEDIRDEFSRRLEDAFARSDATPRKKHGRYVWLKEQMRDRGITLTGETIRRWFTGGVMPQPDAMAALAAIIGVDPGWLAHGTSGHTRTLTGPEAEEMSTMSVDAHRNALASSYMVGRLGIMGIDAGPESSSGIELTLNPHHKVLCNVTFGLVGADGLVTVDFPNPERASGRYRPLFLVVGRGGKEPDVFFFDSGECSMFGPGKKRFGYGHGAVHIPVKSDKGEQTDVIVRAETDLLVLHKLL